MSPSNTLCCNYIHNNDSQLVSEKENTVTDTKALAIPVQEENGKREYNENEENPDSQTCLVLDGLHIRVFFKMMI